MFKSEKPLIRWLVGPVHPVGFQILRHSVIKISKIYGDEFDLVICHNNLKPKQFKFIQSLGVPLHAQQQEHGGLLKKFTPWRCSWKFYPPRMRPNQHELFLDNDIVIWQRIPSLDRFLASDEIIVTEAFKRCYGRYDKLVKADVNLNTGFFGLPPNLDFESKIMEIISKLNTKNNPYVDHFDMQGIMAAIAVNHGYIYVPRIDISVCVSGWEKGKYGDHFIGSNSGVEHHWLDYRQHTLI